LEFPLAIGNCCQNCQLKNKEALLGNFKGLSQDEGRADFAKISAPLPFMKAFDCFHALLATSILTDSAFKGTVA
jgi:hypothetical protein